jgi:hypothetical protein
LTITRRSAFRNEFVEEFAVADSVPEDHVLKLQQRGEMGKADANRLPRDSVVR